jgi:hypothetical protein
MTAFSAPATSELSTEDILSDLSHTGPVEVIETVISSLEKPGTAMVSHTDEGYLWKFEYGSTEVFVQLTGLTDDDRLTVWSAILTLPVQNEPALLARLLELNWTETMEARFAISGQNVVVVSTRTTADMSPGEISRAITIVASLADEHDDRLQAEFKAA